MSQRKRLSELSRKRQQDRINEQMKEDINKEIDNLNNLFTQENLEFLCQNEILEQTNTAGDLPQLLNVNVINEVPLFEANSNIEGALEYVQTDDVEKYLYERIFKQFCDNVGITDNTEEDELLESKEYSYSDSEDEEDDGLEEGLKDIGKNMTKADLTKLLKLLQRFGHDELPNTAEKLLSTPRQTKITLCEEGEYFHYGLEQCLKNLVDNGEKLPQIIWIDIGSDGLPLSKSGKRKLWPITGRVCNVKTTSPFLIGCYHGFKSPTKAMPYLEKFIEEFKRLQEISIKLGDQFHKIVLRCVICDTPARCLVTGTQLYNGYYGCIRCEVRGNWLKKTVFFTGRCAVTGQQFFSRTQTA